jgi:uncharacterized protein (TIGR00725 family)
VRDVQLSTVTVGVVGSGTDEHDDLAREVGTLLAGLGVNLLTGGGQGIMASVSRAFSRAPRRRGICIGIIPCASEEERGRPRIGYPNEFVELAIYTHLPYSGKRGKDDLSRNHINVLSSAALIALPGGHGTSAEVELALDYGTPLIAFARDATLVKHFPAAVPRASTIDGVEKFVRRHAGDATRTMQ